MTEDILSFARKSIESIFSKETPPTPMGPFWKQEVGCFVTLIKNDELRGCIGYITSKKPLAQTVFEAAQAACIHDPRFPPVKEQELKDIKIEVSLLSKPRKINNTVQEKMNSFIGGKTGLIIQKGWKSGVLLPQVFDENTPVEEALSMVCEKAEIPKNAWKEETTTLYTITANILQEK